ncbi:hypothetical protein [Streptomyces sp. NPDC058989]|uniref:hypothetical protein n=1 Tax=Streptomyces sp. NPDC058989 TaxID=3346686 RepID=UPI0036C55955
MDRDEKTAHLEWWANQRTCLARLHVRVTATAGAGEWEAVIPPPLDHGTFENLKQLIDTDPCLTLRFDDSTVEVQAEDFDDNVGHLRLAAIPTS